MASYADSSNLIRSERERRHSHTEGNRAGCGKFKVNLSEVKIKYAFIKYDV